MKLEDIYNKSKNSENKFKHKNILFIGSESYDAPTITVIQGLEELGFNIYTINKSNINSWFCNKIINNTNQIKFDFILSNLHWGTRWSYYKKYNLNFYPKILIDGDDNLNWKTWKEKFENYKKIYVFEPREEIKNKELSPFRWIEPVDKYNPDIIFTAQKQFGDNESCYLPFGIHREYFSLCENKSTKQRKIDFIHIEGPGIKRKKMKKLIKKVKFFKILPGNIINGYIRGEKKVPKEIKNYIKQDSNIHSYHRWTMGESYFKTLNNSKVLIYPGIDHWPFWDSKRPWEAYVSGCLVLMSKPCIDVYEYPLTEICEYAVYDSSFELIKKCRYLYKSQSFLDKLRIKATENAVKYFSPKPIANYFLRKIYETTT